MDKIILENAWREYRCDGALSSWLGRMIDLRSRYELSADDTLEEFLREQPIGGDSLSLPSPGSSYWSECIDPPRWFRAMFDYSDFDPLEALRAAKKLRKVNRHIRGKRLRAGHAVKVSLNIKSS